MKFKTLACLSLIVFIASFTSAQQKASTPSLVDWPQFNFDAAHDGYNSYETILSPTNVGNVTLKWSYSPGNVVAGTPVVANGAVYFATSDFLGSAASRPEFTNAVFAVDADSGAPIWTSEIVAPVFGSPAVADGMVYVNSDAVYALDAGTGALLWQYQVRAQYSSPTVVNDIVYVTSTDHNVYALNAKTGALIWSYTTAGEIYTSPSVADGVLYVSSGSGNVYALNAGTGALVWKKQFGNSIGPSPSLSGTEGGQAVANGVLYVCIKRNGNGNVYDLYALDASKGTILWRLTSGSLAFCTPTVANGVVYIASGNLVYALDAGTGLPVWQHQIFGGAHSPIVANGVVYVGSWAGGGEGTGYGVVTAVDAGTGALLWNYQSSTTGGYTSFPSPAVVNGTIYGSLGGIEVGAWSLPN